MGLNRGLRGSGGSMLTVPVSRHHLGRPAQPAIGGSLLVEGLCIATEVAPLLID